MGPFFAIGSCYLIRQVPGSERVGGLEVKIRPRRSEQGQIEVLNTHWQTGELLDLSMSDIASAAVDGIKAFASEHGLALDEYDITLQRFLWHPVDSSPGVYRQTGRSAFRTAWEGLRLQEFE